jgi:hypothetical protein
MTRKSILLALFFSLAISTLGFAKGKPATEPGDDRGGNNPGTGVDDNHNNRQRGKTPPPATALIAKGKPATEPGDDRGGNNPGTGVDDNHNNRQRGKTPPPATA